jgi:hypothetical protein
MNAETAPTDGAEKDPHLGTTTITLPKESKGEAYVSVERILPHSAARSTDMPHKAQSLLHGPRVPHPWIWKTPLRPQKGSRPMI